MQETAYEMRISDWSSDVCSSDRFGLLGLASFRRAENEAVERARYWLDKIKLTAKADVDAGALAYGDQRRLEIARAMCIDPVLLCLDEPAAGLNPNASPAPNNPPLSTRQESRTPLPPHQPP